MLPGIYPVSQQLYNEMQELDEHWFYRFKYIFPNPILTFDDDIISIFIEEQIMNREFIKFINKRNEFKKKYNFNYIMNDPILKYSNDYISIIKHYTITYDLPKYLKQKRNNVRLEICRIMNHYNLPADLTPTICAFTVSHSKIYNYM